MTTTRKDSLWALIAGPTIWSVYFLAVYVAAAIICAKSDTAAGDVAVLRGAVAAFGTAALAAIGGAGIRAWRRWRSAGGGLPPHGDDTHQSRHQFMSLATLLLCGLSFVATIYVAMPAAFITTCR